MGKTRMLDTFIEMVKIDSETWHEQEMHRYLLDKFQSLGLTTFEDNSMATTKLGSNNLVAKLAGTLDAEPIFFSSHTDTVVPGKGIEVEERDGMLYSKGETILGADDKAGIAIMLEAIQRIQEEGIETGPLEFVLSPGEELGLVGASALDFSLLEAKRGYVLDSAGEVGRVTIASPYLFKYNVTITGKSAHAGLAPETGISCVDILTQALPKIKTGRLDAETTANIGSIHGGEVTNIVLDKLTVYGEVRSIDLSKVETLLDEMKEAFETAAVEMGGSVEIEINQYATGFRINKEQKVMQTLQTACDQLGLTVQEEVSGGGSDANAFNANGLEAVNLSIGYEEIHTVKEYVSIAEMEKAVDLVVELIKTVATVKTPELVTN